MMSIDIAVNGKQIAYISIVNKGSLPSGEHFYTVNIQDDENFQKAKAVQVTHKRSESYITLLKKVFIELERTNKA